MKAFHRIIAVLFIVGAFAAVYAEEEKEGMMGEGEATATLAFFPTHDKLVIKLHAGSESMLERGLRAEIRIYDEEGVKRLHGGVINMRSLAAEVSFDTTGLAAGKYAIDVVFTRASVDLPKVMLAFEKKERPR